MSRVRRLTEFIPPRRLAGAVKLSEMGGRAEIYMRDVLAESLVRMWEEGRVVIPEDLQRGGFVWSEQEVFLWCDSLAGGIASLVPIITWHVDGSYVVIDGKHRVIATAMCRERHPELWRVARLRNMSMLVIEGRLTPQEIVVIFARINRSQHPPSSYVIAWAARFGDPALQRAYRAIVGPWIEVLCGGGRCLDEPERVATQVMYGYDHAFSRSVVLGMATPLQGSWINEFLDEARREPERIGAVSRAVATAVASHGAFLERARRELRRINERSTNVVKGKVLGAAYRLGRLREVLDALARRASREEIARILYGE